MSAVDYSLLEPMLRGRFQIDVICPVCSASRKPANRKLRVLRLWRKSADAITFKCMHCDIDGIVTADGTHERHISDEEIDRLEREAIEKQRRVEAKRAKTALEIWRGSKPGREAGAGRYFDHRGLDVPDWLWPRIRFDPMSYFGVVQMRLPAIVLPFSDFESPGRIVGVHRIALTADFRNFKHEGKSLKISNGAFSGRGAIMLQQPWNGALCVCEGFETALAVMMGGVNQGAAVWATTGREFLAAIPPLEDIHRLIIAADNDHSGDGVKSAKELARSWGNIADIFIEQPKNKGEDYADVYNKFRMEDLDGPGAAASDQRNGARDREGAAHVAGIARREDDRLR